MSSFVWRLRTLMDERQMTDTSALRPLLAARGIELSREQVFRLVKYPPERLSMQTLVALCAIFECQPNDLIEISDAVASAPRPRRASAAKPQPVPLSMKRVKL